MELKSFKIELPEITMKIQRIFAVTVIIAFAGPATAASLTIPNTFVSGEAARAAEVNENFTAVKTEVDDNNARIVQNAAEISFKLDRLDGGTCGAGETMRGINPSGGPICGTDIDTDTQYIAGPGLSLDTVTGEFTINPTETQKRINDTPCSAAAAELSIKSIDVDGNVTCETDDNTTYTAGTGMQLSGTNEFLPADGFVSVPYSALVATNVSRTRTTAPSSTGTSTVGGVIGGGFHSHTIGTPRSVFIPQVCQLVPQRSTTGAYTYFDDNVSENCDAFAPLNLPHNASISSLSCKVLDNSTNNSLQVRLYRVPLTGTGETQELIFSSNLSVSQADPQLITSQLSDPAATLVENNNYAYHLQMIWETSTLGDNFRVYGCSVGYSYL